MKTLTADGYISKLSKQLRLLDIKHRAKIGLEEGLIKSYDINDYIAGTIQTDDAGKVSAVSLLLTNPVDGNAMLYYIIAGIMIDLTLNIDQKMRNLILVKMLNNGEPEHLCNGVMLKFKRLNNLVAFDVIKA